MTEPLRALLAELERFGATNDVATTERSRRMLNVTPDTGEFLSVLVRAMAARRVLEMGTSNGYPTLWLARAARAICGTVTTVEFSEYKENWPRESSAARVWRNGSPSFTTTRRACSGARPTHRSI